MVMLLTNLQSQYILHFQSFIGTNNTNTTHKLKFKGLDAYLTIGMNLQQPAKLDEVWYKSENDRLTS